jgi:hypothetical protein
LVGRERDAKLKQSIIEDNKKAQMLKQSGLLKKQTITIYENNKPFGLMFKRIPYERAQGGSKLTEGDLTPSLITSLM